MMQKSAAFRIIEQNRGRFDDDEGWQYLNCKAKNGGVGARAIILDDYNGGTKTLGAAFVSSAHSRRRGFTQTIIL